ncbi:MAG: hypothetical protein ORO03_06800, partial [Alphaproteobacteria bacterium]|nr:hypothetical protein [Alphaproteobacteria bacterium]
MGDLLSQIGLWFQHGTDFIVSNKFPFGDYMTIVINALTHNGSGLFSVIKISLDSLIQATIQLFSLVPPLVLVALMVTGIWFLHRAIVLTVLSGLALLLIINLG